MANLEADLVSRARSGDLSAFDELVSLHQDRVFALARRILGNDEDAADVQQETFIRAWRSLPKFRQESEFATWLHRITVNLCLTRKRSKREISADETLFVLGRMHSAQPTALDSLERAELLSEIRRALLALPVHYRVLIVLREMENRSFEEIAKLLGCSEGGARTRACRARQMLRQLMRPYLQTGEELPAADLFEQESQT
ncbi:MAG: sigma-70 family RNA polymerase sigma factor [Armatimonadota bacterium]|nr:sigma-70 family RNA polymerase sigma factor [Armatimonadota bacterium]